MGQSTLKSSGICTMIVATVAISLLLLCVNRGTLAAVALGKAYEHPNYPGQCYDPFTNVAKTVGAMWPMKDGCGRVMCEEMGNSMYLSYPTCPYVSGPPSCNIVQGDYQLMLAAKSGLFATYDVTLNDEDYSNSDSGFSDVFPLWRDIRDGENVGIDDEERPKRFIPKK